MWDRKSLKQKGNQAFRVNYLKCLIMALVISFFVNGGYETFTSNSDEKDEDSIISVEQLQEQYDLTEEQAQEIRNLITEFDSSGIYSVLVNGFTVPTLLIMLLTIFVFNVLEIGGDRFFIENSRLVRQRGQMEPGQPHQPGQEPSLGSNIAYAFRSGNYGTMALAMFLRELFIALWSLLFVIPGIVKMYEYRMVPYIMADHPEMSWQEAFQRSKEMMYGSKWDTFVLDLSFIGWYLLSAITYGIVGILYSNPYYYATCAELYCTLNGETDSEWNNPGGGWNNENNGWNNGNNGWNNENNGWNNGQ